MKGLGGQSKNHVKNVVGKWNRGRLTAPTSVMGYTITEVMVFLAVSSAIFFMIAGTFNQRIRNNDFMTGAREMESMLQDIANDVSTGHYNYPGNLSCTAGVSGPEFAEAPGGGEQGTNAGCIFIGRFIHFDVEESDGKYMNIYTVAGLRKKGGVDVTDIVEASPRAVYDSAAGIDLTEEVRVPSSVVIKSIYSENGGHKDEWHGVGFFTTFEGASLDAPSSLSMDVIPLRGDPDNSKDGLITSIMNIGTTPDSLSKNPPNGIVVCMDSASTDQHAILKIGANRSRSTTDVEILQGSCPS